MKNDDKNDNEKTKKIIKLFEETLEYIDFTEIEQITNKINEYNMNETLEGSNISQSIFLQRNIDNFPIYNDSFEDSINMFIRKNKIKDINLLYQSIIKEIKKVYYGYTHIEQKMYNKMNIFIRFKDAKNNDPLQIISKLKEIKDTINDTIRFIEQYLFINMNYLKKIFSKIDEKLGTKLGMKSISLYFLLDIFDLPNNELSYMLMFKVIDEISCILRYITSELNLSLHDKVGISNNQINNNKDNQSNLSEQNQANNSIDAEAMINLNDKYVKDIYDLLNKLDEYNKFRAKYYNKYLYIMGNFQVDTNRFLYYDYENDITEEFLQINTLMDEELIINKFLDHSLINKFLNYFQNHLSNVFKRNEKLIYFHSIYYNIISIITIYSISNYSHSFLEISMFFVGKIIGKIIFNSLIKRRKKLKNLLLVSNTISLISLMFLIFDNNQKIYILIRCFAKLLIGFSYCKNIETKFILNYIPKLLIKRNIKKYFKIKYLSISIGFFLLAAFSYLPNYFDNRIINIDMSIICFFNLLIIIINCWIFREPRLDHIINLEENSKVKIKNMDDMGHEEKENIINIEENNLNISDSIVNNSYGKAKFISFKERNKAKLIENSIKSEAGKDNYEGINHIFTNLKKLMNNENSSKSSYTYQSTRGYIFFLTIFNIILSIVLFYNPLVNAIGVQNDDLEHNMDKIQEFKKKIWTFGISYLICFFIFKFKLFSLQKKLSQWNSIILLFIIFQLILTSLFLISDNKFFSYSPIVFDNYLYILFNSVIIFVNLLIEKACLKIIIREIPIEVTIFRTNIDNFLDIYINFNKAVIFAIFYALSFINVNSAINYYFIYKIFLITFILIELVIFLVFFFKRKQLALIKIINKVTYEAL